MKTLSAFALGLAVSSLIPLSAAAQAGLDRDRGRDRVCVYQDIHYQGWEECYSPGNELPNLERRNDAVSSIRVFGRAAVLIYRDVHFQGESIFIHRDAPDLATIGVRSFGNWNDQISSLEIDAERGRTRGRR